MRPTKKKRLVVSSDEDESMETEERRKPSPSTTKRSKKKETEAATSSLALKKKKILPSSSSQASAVPSSDEEKSVVNDPAEASSLAGDEPGEEELSDVGVEDAIIASKASVQTTVLLHDLINEQGGASSKERIRNRFQRCLARRRTVCPFSFEVFSSEHEL
jgi:hypothetical protein